jgi:hypothetical protein
MSGMTSPSSYNHDFLQDTIGLTLEFLSDIILDIQTIGEFTPEKEFIWNRKIMKLTKDISLFVELTTLLSKTIMARKGRTLPEIKNSHIHLLFIMKGMNSAQLKQDIVALEDLIKYELKDNLTQWKIDLIPQTKKLLNT